MTRGVMVRTGRPSDIDFVVALLPSFVDFGLPPWREAELLIPRFRDALSSAFSCADGLSTVLVAESRHEQPLGFIHLEVVQDISGDVRGHVADLAVVESARGTGVGRALMEAGEAWARRRDLGYLSLEVWSTNHAALAFYEHLGYGVDSLNLIRQLD